MKKMLVILSILAASCSSTKIIQTWKAPDASYTPVQFQKVLIIALSKDEASRRIAEDKIASRSSAFHASYLLFPNKQIIGEEQRFKTVIKENGFDGVVTVRLLSKDKENEWVAGNYTDGFWKFRNDIYTTYYQPGYFQDNLTYTVEATVFSMNQDKLLWSGISQATKASSIKHAVEDVLKEVIAQMKKEKLLPEK
jgi:hypothetical protein